MTPDKAPPTFAWEMAFNKRSADAIDDALQYWSREGGDEFSTPMRELVAALYILYEAIFWYAVEAGRSLGEDDGPWGLAGAEALRRLARGRALRAALGGDPGWWPDGVSERVATRALADLGVVFRDPLFVKELAAIERGAR